MSTEISIRTKTFRAEVTIERFYMGFPMLSISILAFLDKERRITCTHVCLLRSENDLEHVAQLKISC